MIEEWGNEELTNNVESAVKDINIENTQDDVDNSHLSQDSQVKKVII